MQAAGVRYDSVFHAISSIYATNGIVGFYKASSTHRLSAFFLTSTKGVVPTTQRAALLTASQLGSYDHIKQALLTRGGLHEAILLHFVSSFFAVPTRFDAAGFSVTSCRVSLQRQ